MSRHILSTHKNMCLRNTDFRCVIVRCVKRAFMLFHRSKYVQHNVVHTRRCVLFSWASCEYVRRVTINDKSVLHKREIYTIRTRLGEYPLSETTLLCCIWHIALALELNQLVITRSAELHNEGSAAPSTEQGNPATLWFFTLCLLFKVITLMLKCRKTSRSTRWYWVF